jgi:Protein of unknown function (DUF3089)
MDLPRALRICVSLVITSFLSLGCEETDIRDGTKNSNDNAAAADASGSAQDAQPTQSDAGTTSTLDAGSNATGDAAADAAADAASADAGLPAADYATAENWLCRPDRTNDACHVDLDTTIVSADGGLQVEKFTPAASPAIDCFYVYPTVSIDPTDNSDLIPAAEENNVVRAQFARFASQCRLFAPMYRQVTLTALRATIAGTPVMPDRALGYRDVLAAWQWYMKNENKGRGVVLVGHSQGSGVLVQLIKEQIDPDPSKVPLLAAFLPGTNLTVPPGQAVGGSFQKVPVCKTPEQLGCVVSYVSFRVNAPPPMNTRFGTTMTAGQTVACANPAALAGGPAELRSYFSVAGAGASGLPMPPWINGNDPAKMVTTPFVNVPGMISAECKSDATGSYLAVTIKGDPADPRVDDIVGDVVTNNMVQADWGLHLIDVHLTMGNMLDLVAAKAKAFSTR